MKARIEKKLSRRLVQLAPTLFRKAWVDGSEPSELAHEQGTSVNHVYSIGGGTDFAGDGQDLDTTWEWWKQHWTWNCDFPIHPERHPHGGFPDTGSIKPTTLTLLRLAVRAEAFAVSEERRIKDSRRKYALTEKAV
ncbi:hypothetical protein ACRCPS_17380 [Pseudomonas aeruginosa]